MVIHGHNDVALPLLRPVDYPQSDASVRFTRPYSLTNTEENLLMPNLPIPLPNMTIPPKVVLSILFAILAGLFVAALVKWLLGAARSAPERGLAAYYNLSDGKSGEDELVSISKEGVILASLGLPPNPHWLTGVKIASALVPGLIVLIAGWPLIIALGAGGLGFMLVSAWLEGRWRNFQVKIEEDLPTFVAQLAGVLQLTDSASVALDEVVKSMPQRTPLRVWMERFTTGVQLHGQAYIERVREKASEISPSLGLTVFFIGRLSETGGGQFADAFTTVADELGAILEARAVASSKAAAAKQNVHMMIGILAFISILLFRSPEIREGFAIPQVQVISAVALLAMVFGYAYMNSLIDDALEN